MNQSSREFLLARLHDADLAGDAKAAQACALALWGVRPPKVRVNTRQAAVLSRVAGTSRVARVG